VILRFYIKRVVFFITDLLVRVLYSCPSGGDGVLVVRLDAIGDYVLFRNFLADIKASDKYKNKKITLVGNIAWREIAEFFDSDVVDDFIWIDRSRFVRNIRYRFNKLSEIRSCCPTTVIQPTYSREFFLGDSVVNICSAREKIGSVGDCSNIKSWQKKISDLYYTKLIPASESVLFEFDRNKEFFAHLLGSTVLSEKPCMSKPKGIDLSRFNLPDSYAVFFIGASASFRKWSVYNYSLVAEYIYSKYSLPIVLCGGPGDVDDAEEFLRGIGCPVVDLVGKTSLVEFVNVLSKSEVVISNETSTPHFAVALGVKNIFVVSNGNHIVRFSPYPDYISKSYHVVYHPDILKNPEYYFSGEGAGTESVLNINDIAPEAVVDLIDAKLSFE
jgi:ADP-heptose:LPS heptosyltransferase